jgi:hypothetical protein
LRLKHWVERQVTLEGWRHGGKSGHYLRMAVPDTQKLKLESKSWLAHINFQVSGPDTPAVAAGRKLLEAVHNFERLTGPRSKSFGAVIPVTGLNKNSDS